MKNPLTPLFVSVLVFASSLGLRADVVVYDNSTTKLDIAYGGSQEFGDEITLAGTERWLSTLIFEYFARDFSGDESIRLRIYSNDGSSTGTVPNASRPGSLLYDSGWDAFFNTGPDGLTLSYDLSSANVVVSNNFTWTVEFQGVSGSEFAGLQLYSPPTTGSSYDDFWERDGLGNWQQRQADSGVSMNFGARVSANIAYPVILSQSGSSIVPEGSTATLSVTMQSAPALVFQWYKNGQPLVGATQSSLVFNNVTTANAGTYRVTITNSWGSAMTTNVTLAVTVAQPFVRAAGKYNGLFYSANGISEESSGFCTFVLRTNRSFSGKLLFDGDSVSISGKFDTQGLLTTNVSRAKIGKENISVHLALDFLTWSDSITGTFSNSAWSADVTADREAFSITNPATAFQNNYTILFPGLADANDGPPGYGYGVVNVTSNGVLKLGSSALPDRTAINQKVGLSKNGEWPFFKGLYRVTRNYVNLITGIPFQRGAFNGSVLGWLTITNGRPSGVISWIKPGGSGGLVYPGGFTNESAVISSVYTEPPYGTRAIDMTNGIVTLTDGNLLAPVVQNFTLSETNSITFTNKREINLTLNLGRGAAYNGLLRGSFLHPVTLTRPRIYGVVIQDQNLGAGFFLGPTQGGTMLLTPAP